MTKSTTMKVLAGVGIVAGVTVIGGLIYWGIKEATSEAVADEIAAAVKASVVVDQPAA